MIILLSTIAALALVYLFCLKGRSGHPGMAELRRWNYAHRGLHDSQRPENSMAAFRAAKEKGYGIELDIHLMKDGNLAVIHDSSLKRVAGADINIEDLTLSDLENYRLGDTNEKIPLFSQVLALYEGKAPLIVELKAAGDNYKQLCRSACQMLDGYKGDYCIESFDPRCIIWLRHHRPDIIRGQLSENWMKSDIKLPWILKFVMTTHISNLVTRPDFIAYNYKHRKIFGTDICRKLWKVQGVSWTIRTKNDFNIAVNEGWIPIFENFIPEDQQKK